VKVSSSPVLNGIIQSGQTDLRSGQYRTSTDTGPASGWIWSRSEKSPNKNIEIYISSRLKNTLHHTSASYI